MVGSRRGSGTSRGRRNKKLGAASKTRKVKVKGRGAKKKAVAKKTKAVAKKTKAVAKRRAQPSITALDRGRNESRAVERALVATVEAATPGLTRGGGGGAGALIGVVKVEADKWGDGYDLFRVRADLADAYSAVRARVLASGGVVTSSGGLRAVNVPATSGRSKTRLHYTARAIDLNVSSGMQARETPYIVVRDGGSEEHPLWKIYCRVTSPDGEGEVRTLDALVWRKGQAPAVKTQQVRCICLTDMMEEGGWQRIPARSGWRDGYMSCEWWHFQNQTGLETGVSLFGDELKKVWPEADVNRSGLALDAVWGNQSFVA